MTNFVDNNEVFFDGKVVSELKYTFTKDGKDYYKFFVASKRLSDVEDVIPIIISQSTINKYKAHIKIGKFVSIVGEYKSINRGGKLLLFILVDAIIVYKDELNGVCRNDIFLGGHICKKSSLRLTPSGKKLLDILVVTHGEDGKASYIPCIIWEPSEEQTININVGNEISLEGRIQSREYLKIYPDDTSETKIAYEVSVRRFV